MWRCFFPLQRLNFKIVFFARLNCILLPDGDQEIVNVNHGAGVLQTCDLVGRCHEHLTAAGREMLRGCLFPYLISRSPVVLLIYNYGRRSKPRNKMARRRQQCNNQQSTAEFSDFSFIVY